MRIPQGRPRVILAVAVILIGAAMIVGSVVAFHHDRTTPTAFGDPTPPASSSSSAPTTAPTPRPTSVRPSPPPTTHVPIPALPVTLALPALNVTASVTQVVARNGVLGVPDDISNVGWWTGSRLPGSPSGSTVIDGHVDSAVTGLGALYHLGQLASGDLVTVQTSLGDRFTYRVYARQVYVKDQGLPADLFATTGPARLVLITCGGPFDSAARSYEDNIAVFATPVTPAA